MKERPLLMSAPMVRALLEGRKTQTRRVVKFDIPSWANHVRNISGAPWNIFQWVEVDKTHHPDGICVKWWPDAHEGRSCLHGKPGDRLWVKETFADLSTKNRGPFVYRADVADGERVRVDAPWRPSIFMPRKVSRILLEITAVWVERLQDISEEDAKAEGIQQEQDGWLDYGNPSCQMCLNPVDSYRTLWESINGAGSWNANPWVWVIEFKRVES